MRSPKSRSRSKANRSRSLGNIVNRVFDSSGPEGKVRGTPQQIIDKYLVLARDAQLSNDRVAAENFLQHAEHYTRMLGEAQREMAREDAARNAAAEQNRDNNRDNPRNQNGQRHGRGHDGDSQGRDNQGRDGQRQPRHERGDQQAESQRDDRPQALRPARDDGAAARTQEAGAASSADVIDLSSGDDGSTLVETPEAPRPAKPRRKPRAPRNSDPAGTAPDSGATETGGSPDDPAEAKPAPRRRAPRKPREEAADSTQSEDVPPSSSAAQ